LATTTGLHLKIGGRFFFRQDFDANNSNGFHTGGAMFVYGDGSVHFLSAAVDPEMFVSLFTAAAGVNIG
jgi:prepilin-type processing-associated H-X9-DG protein